MVCIQKPKGQLWLPKFPTLLYGTNWYPCCGFECPECDFSSDADAFARMIASGWKVDLGVGGWIDAVCNTCDQVLGEYSLSQQNNPISGKCYWIYENPAVTCSGGELYVIFFYTYGTILAWQWTVVVGFGPAIMEARFKTDETDDTDCWHFGGNDSSTKITLTKYYEFGVGAACTGGMPATIEAWVP